MKDGSILVISGEENKSHGDVCGQEEKGYVSYEAAKGNVSFTSAPFPSLTHQWSSGFLPQLFHTLTRGFPFHFCRSFKVLASNLWF